MDDNARAFASNMFRLRVHETTGQAYEDMFVKIMRYANPGFRPVKAQGNIGDRKNDGFDKSTGTYFQVYAPEDIRKSQCNALKKLKADFKGLKAFWHGIYPVKRYVFVVNDKYEGVSATIEKQLVEIQRCHKLEEATVLIASGLEDILFGLSDARIISIVGHVPHIEPADFLFLSGFTYFIGAWIEFEKTARHLIEDRTGPFRPMVGTRMIHALVENNLIESDQALFARTLSDKRNRLVHGDSNGLPAKEQIDKLVLMTEALKRVPGTKGPIAI